MNKEEKELITDLRRCNFKEIHEYYKAQTEIRKNRSKEEKLVRTFLVFYQTQLLLLIAVKRLWLLLGTSWFFTIQELDCIGAVSFYNSKNLNYIGGLSFLQFKEFELYWGAVFF